MCECAILREVQQQMCCFISALLLFAICDFTLLNLWLFATLFCDILFSSKIKRRNYAFGSSIRANRNAISSYCLLFCMKLSVHSTPVSSKYKAFLLNPVSGPIHRPTHMLRQGLVELFILCEQQPEPQSRESLKLYRCVGASLHLIEKIRDSRNRTLKISIQ